MRILGGLILACAVFAVLYFGTIRTERHPLLMDAAYPDENFCDVTYSPRPLLKPTSRQWSRKDDRT